MFNPIVIRSLVYAGLLSNAMAVIVCLIFNENQLIMGKVFGLLIWGCAYLLHKKMGTW